MDIVYAVLIGMPGVAFTTVQFPNLLRRSLRFKVSIVCVLVAAIGVVAAVLFGNLENSAVGVLTWFFGSIGLSYKWFNEVQDDVTAREEKGLPPLLRSRVLPVSIRSVVDGFYQARYRRKMFRDPWSRRYLIGLSQPLPRSLMDDRTVADLERAYKEQDDAEKSDQQED